LKLHNRIALLEKEEEKANKRIEDARKQALSIIRQKIEKEQFQQKLSEQKKSSLLMNQNQVKLTREEAENI
jgi:hypothetical protein